MEDVKGLATKLVLKHRTQSLLLENGVLNFTLELLELTDRNTREKRHVAQIDYGCGLSQHIRLPSDDYKRAYGEVEKSLREGNYTIQVSSDGSVEIFVNDKSEGVKKT